MKKDVPTPEDFTLSLALVDAVPVLLFSISCLTLYRFFHSVLFLAGAVCCALAGCGKVLWKLLLVTAQRNVPLLNRQMRVLMPTGFLVILVSLIVDRRLVSVSGMAQAVTCFPSCMLFLLFFVGMVMMGVFAKTLDSADLRSNWIEQLTNAAAQLCLLLGILLVK